jgi:hypothetical protein
MNVLLIESGNEILKDLLARGDRVIALLEYSMSGLKKLLLRFKRVLCQDRAVQV